jgi:hypothetical protein
VAARVAAALLVAALLAPCAVPPTAVAAAPAGTGVPGSFPDAQGHWAEKAIARMSIKGIITGYSDGTFAPDRSVTRLEAVVMLVRSLALEAEAKSRTTIPASFSNPEFVPAWAKGYVGVAVDRGIIAGTDLLAFRGADPASRLDAAVFVVRALGLSTQATRAGASLAFTDAAAIPAAMRGYVAIVTEQGLMVGNADGSFQPAQAVTRAAMATILLRLDDALDNALDQAEVRGALAAVTLGSSMAITIRRGEGAQATTTTVPVTSTARVFIDSVRVALASLIVGDTVMALLDTAGRAVYVETQPPTQTVTGTIAAVSTGASSSISVSVTGGATASYYLTAATRVQVDGRPAAFSDLRAGMTVTLTLQGGALKQVRAEGQARTVTATLMGCVYGPPSLITVQLGDLTRATFPLADGCAIKRDGVAAALTALLSGDSLTLQLRGEALWGIDARAGNRDVSGVLERVAYAPPAVTVRTSAGSETFPLADDVTVVRGGRMKSLADLRAGDVVQVRVSAGEVVRIEAQPVEGEVEGTVVAVTIAAAPMITVRTAAGRDETYPVAAGATIKKGRTRIALNEILPGYRATMTIESGEAVTIYVEAVTVLEDFRGTVEYVVESAEVIVVAVDGAGTGSEPREVHITDDTIFIADHDVVDFEDIAEGDRVVVIGAQRSGIFYADVVVVISIND